MIYQIFAGSHEVFMATNGEQALALCRRLPPDLVLLDMLMPGMSGLEVCRQLKRQPETRDIPVIFVSAHSAIGEENACWEAGAVDFVNKPINATTLRNRVNAHLTIKFQADLLREMAFIDGLTGAANRRRFDERLQQEWHRCGRARQPLSLIMADVDFFKSFNDTYGHQRGDDCLHAIATVLKGGLRRPGDLVARYGGEEFVCLLPETPLGGAMDVACMLERAVRAIGIEHTGSSVAPVVTISLGVACMLPDFHHSANNLVTMADDLLYQAKQTGRARAVCDPAQLRQQRVAQEQEDQRSQGAA